MRMLYGIALIVSIFFLAACTNDNKVPNEPVQESENVDEQGEKLTALEEKVEQLEQELQKLKREYVSNDQYDELRDEITILNRVVNTSDLVDIDLGYIVNLDEDNGSAALHYQYAEWLTGDEALDAYAQDSGVPREEAALGSGFYIRKHEDDIRTYSLSEDVIVFFVENVRRSYVTKEAFFEYARSAEHMYRVFEFYVVNDEVVVIQERYTP